MKGKVLNSRNYTALFKIVFNLKSRKCMTERSLQQFSGLHTFPILTMDFLTRISGGQDNVSYHDILISE